MEPERPSARSSPARGVALIATAVILGVFVLRSGFEGPSTSGDTGDTTSEAAVAESAGTTAPPGQGGTGTTAAPPVRPPGEVTVVVANTTDVGGAARERTDQIAGLGYLTGTATDAEPPVEASQVLFLEGYQGEATALAGQIGIQPANVVPMPPTPPAELGNAQLLVLLGPDLAPG